MLASRAQPRLTEVQLTPVGLEHALPLPGELLTFCKVEKNICIFIFITTIRFQAKRKVLQRAKESSEIR